MRKNPKNDMRKQEQLVAHFRQFFSTFKKDFDPYEHHTRKLTFPDGVVNGGKWGKCMRFAPNLPDPVIARSPLKADDAAIHSNPNDNV